MDTIQTNTLPKKTMKWMPIVALPVILTTLLCTVIIFITKQKLWWLPQISYAIANLFTVLLIIYLMNRNNISLAVLGFKNFRWKDVLLAFLFFFAGIFLWWGLSIVLEQIGIAEQWRNKYPLKTPIHYFVITLWVSIAAICEEIIFRGYFLSVLQTRFPVWIAMAVSIVTFALVHLPFFGIAVGIEIMVWSLFPSILFVWRKSLYPGIFMHLLNNIFAYLLLPLMLS